MNHAITKSFIFGPGKKCIKETLKSIESFELSVKIWFQMPTIWFKNMFSQKLSDKAKPAGRAACAIARNLVLKALAQEHVQMNYKNHVASWN
ncbi:hypothetical protein SD81_038080 [Tolypothrix campylonemoides VB511288]|nr:hypothetical protein SD81_038080 [Tolypothrix campylonemoides VB511288]